MQVNLKLSSAEVTYITSVNRITITPTMRSLMVLSRDNPQTLSHIVYHYRVSEFASSFASLFASHVHK